MDRKTLAASQPKPAGWKVLVTLVVRVLLVATGLLSPLASSCVVDLSPQTALQVLANWHRRVNFHVLVCPTDPAAPRELPMAPERRSAQPSGVLSLKSGAFWTSAVHRGAAHPSLEEGKKGFVWVQTPQCLALRLSWLWLLTQERGRLRRTHLKAEDKSSLAAQKPFCPLPCTLVLPPLGLGEKKLWPDSSTWEVCASAWENRSG